jgi:hypothetical protein
MGHTPGDRPPESDHLNEHDRRALATLERLAPKSLRGLWHRLEFRLMTLWRPRLAICVGMLLMLASVLVIWAELSSHLVIAVASELVLVAGALIVGRGVWPWWQWRQTKQAASR